MKTLAMHEWERERHAQALAEATRLAKASEQTIVPGIGNVMNCDVPPWLARKLDPDAEGYGDFVLWWTRRLSEAAESWRALDLDELWFWHEGYRVHAYKPPHKLS